MRQATSVELCVNPANKICFITARYAEELRAESSGSKLSVQLLCHARRHAFCLTMQRRQRPKSLLHALRALVEPVGWECAAMTTTGRRIQTLRYTEACNQTALLGCHQQKHQPGGTFRKSQARGLKRSARRQKQVINMAVGRQNDSPCACDSRAVSLRRLAPLRPHYIKAASWAWGRPTNPNWMHEQIPI